MIGLRIKRAREVAGLNQRALAEVIGVSAMAISKYERDEITPSSPVLIALAKALNVRVEYFFRQVTAELTDVDYRAHDKLPAKEEAKVIADVEELIERWLELEEFIPTPWSRMFKVPSGLPKSIAALDEIENVATKVRQAWALGLNPIPDLIDTLETKGIKVFVTQHGDHKHFEGLSARVGGSPVIVVAGHIPGDRQRFTLAHELGHLILKGRLVAKLNEEAACHRFAGAFLVPRDKVFAALGQRRTWLEPQEIHSLKHEYGLSMQGWIYRAMDLEILSKTHAGMLWGYFRKRGWKETEPGRPYPNEIPRLFEQLVYHSLAEDIIGEAKAAELLRMSVAQLHACRKMDCPDAVVNQ